MMTGGVSDRFSAKAGIMSANTIRKSKESTRIAINPPTFSPPREMRAVYLENHKDELPKMLASARAGDWKPVLDIANHVRGTGAMYGFANIGEAAEKLVKAVENGYNNSLAFLEQYVKAVSESYV